MNALLLIFGLMLNTAVYNGNPATHSILGKVLDEKNMEGLTGASVSIAELDQVVYASFDGSFEMGNVPDGIYTLEVRCVSYERMVFHSVEVKNSKVYKKIFLSPL
jgi:hypothetical protein